MRMLEIVNALSVAAKFSKDEVFSSVAHFSLLMMHINEKWLLEFRWYT